MREWVDHDGAEKEIYFVAVSREPFENGHSFIIHIKRPTDPLAHKTKSAPLSIKYDGRINHRYIMVLDKVVPLDGNAQP